MKGCARLWVLTWAVGAAWAALAAPVHAAELIWQAPPGCPAREHVIEQVEELLRRPLAEVEGLAFDVSVSEVEGGRFNVAVHTLIAGDRRAERQIAGGSCREVTDAAAVAIAMAVSETEADRAEWELPPARTEASETAEPAANGAASDRADAGASAAASESSAGADADAAESPWALRLALGVAGDVGMLPAFVAGVQLATQVDYGPLGLRAYGALFASAEASVTQGRGAGEFGLAAIGGELCGHRAFAARYEAALCGGAEAARVSGEGTDVDRSYERGVWLAALRAEAGFVFWLLEGLGVALRAGLAVPLSHPQFVLNDSESVHQVSTVAGRFSLELELRL